MTYSEAELLRCFHSQVRLRHREDEPAPGIVLDRDGPVLRRYPVRPRTSYCMVECPEGLDGRADHWIARVVDFFGASGEEVEWKVYGYDGPPDLTQRLVAAGFEPQDEEALVLGEAAGLVHKVELPRTVRLRELDASDVRDFQRIGELMSLVWGRRDRTADALLTEKRGSPGSVDVVVAEECVDGPVLCAAWIRYTPGTEFASFWGGSTHPDWRRKGLYRALVTHRAARALERGYPLVRVDCSPVSRPILTRLGLRSVASTTPYVRLP